MFLTLRRQDGLTTAEVQSIHKILRIIVENGVELKSCKQDMRDSFNNNKPQVMSSHIIYCNDAINIHLDSSFPHHQHRSGDYV